MSKTKKIVIIVISSAVAVMVLLALLCLPVVKFFAWESKTTAEINKVIKVVNKNNPTVESKNMLSLKENLQAIEKVEKAIQNNKDAFAEAEKNIQPGTGFWGLDVSGKKAKTEKYSQKIKQILKNLNNDTEEMLVATSVAKTVSELSKLESATPDAESLGKQVKLMKDISAKLIKQTKGTFLEADGKLIGNNISDMAVTLEKFLNAVEKGNFNEAMELRKSAEKSAKKFESNSNLFPAKVMLLEKEYEMNINMFKKTVDALR